jgi:hypothetical protein
MTIVLPFFQDTDFWEYETILDASVYIIRGRKISPATEESFYVFDLVASDGEVLESGMRALPNVRFAFRSRNEWLPVGYFIFDPIESVLIYETV